jgi:uncharacterized membrane protein (DUF485 family)
MEITSQTSIKRAGILSLIMFSVMTNHYVFKTGVNAIVLKSFGAMKIPWLELCDATMSIIVIAMLYYIRRIRKRLSDYVIWFSTALSAAMICFGVFWLLQFSEQPLLFSISISGNMLIFAATYCIWMLLTSTAYVRSWATLTIVGIGAQAGVYVGSSLGKQITFANGGNWLPVIVGTVYVLLFPLLAQCIRKFSCGGTKLTQQNGSNNSESESTVYAKSFLVSVLLLVFCGIVYGRAINWRDYYQTMAILSLLCQMALTPLALRTLQIKAGLLIQPLLGISIALITIWKNDVATSLNCILVFTCLDYTVYNAFKERLWVHQSLVNKVFSKSFAALLIPKLAGILNAVIILSFNKNVTVSWTIFILVAGMAWAIAAIVSYRASKSYEKLPISVFKPSLDNI